MKFLSLLAAVMIVVSGCATQGRRVESFRFTIYNDTPYLILLGKDGGVEPRGVKSFTNTAPTISIKAVEVFALGDMGFTQTKVIGKAKKRVGVEGEIHVRASDF